MFNVLVSGISLSSVLTLDFGPYFSNEEECLFLLLLLLLLLLLPTCSAQLHLLTHDLFWANVRVQLHLPPLRSLDLLNSPGTL